MRIDSLVATADIQGSWSTNPGSALCGDDRKARPYQVGHAFAMLLNAGIDNLNGVRHLVFGRPESADGGEPVLHQAAHYLLARGAIENFAAALWILGPNSRTERVQRTLRWHVRNVKDQHNAVDRLIPPAVDATRDIKLERLCSLVESATGTVPSGFRSGYTTMDTLRYADEIMPASSVTMSPRFVWQLCSGFAHARPWATLSFNERETHSTEDPEVLLMRATSSMSRALLGPQTGLDMCDRLLRRHAELNRPWHA